MAITLDGTNGITTPALDSTGGSTFTTLLASTSLTTPLVTNAGTLALSATGANIVTASTNGAERLRITSAGNVGIGTSGPSADARLTLSNTNGIQRLGFNLNDDCNINIRAIGGKNSSITFTEEAIEDRWTIGTVAGEGSFRFATGAGLPGTERARIDASGRLQVNTTGRNGMISVANVVGTFPAIHTRTETTAGQGLIEFHNPNGVCGEIVTSGSSTSYNTSSDYRLKEDVQPMVGASDRLMALKPVNFAWKVDGSRVDGFLAHEAQEVVPECVTGEKDQVQIVEIKDEDGNVTGTEERPVHQGIDQSKIVPLLVAALQEALTKIEALEARVAALETNA
jgi:hypothetical protein